MDLRLNGKIAVVTAASRGLGKAVAEALAKEGVNVAICARKKDLLDETAEFIRHEYEVEVLPVVCDVSNPNAIDQFKEIVIELFKTVHILFTNAGGPPSGKLENFSNEDIKSAINLNLLSTVNLVNAFLPYMKIQKWGRILASTSSNVRQLLPQFPLSNISRNSVVAYIKTLAIEVAPLNITANILAPGLFLTEPTKRDIERLAKCEGVEYSQMLDRFADKIPARRVGNPSDYGSLAAFLASEIAGYITGETILIDGGEYSSVM
jgi:3-oxoacyl-[acyl-carrier protein] reductase